MNGGYDKSDLCRGPFATAPLMSHLFNICVVYYLLYPYFLHLISI